ncbi:helix-turn-helix domain-containing protein [Jatrophihabitans cynanchi]|uniref:Helix-turn-helix domain-containing protein n=1 Tax=Jatrophihabitans cynanchi TaxID=2944128 RepID=A0ABY7JV21_9ACTN|nr:helix-turn-helix transcriptional regulator [Jatrophihabitans sp. SB3-54]WAX55545.1 helix-turn-helix domain-containing protein [Jatrophihabitans sp. SB3-54]
MDPVALARAQAETYRVAADADEALVVGPGCPDNARLGEYLKALRVQAGFASRAQAADALGLSSEYLRLVEKGERTPALGQLRNFLTVYSADGAVEKPLANGARPDLVLFNPADGKTAVVEFKSRIREARRPVVLDTNVIAEGLATFAEVQKRLLESINPDGARQGLAVVAAAQKRLLESINHDGPGQGEVVPAEASFQRDALIGSIVGRLAVADATTLKKIAELLDSVQASATELEAPEATRPGPA